MSRIGKLPISIPAGVTVNYDETSHVCTVKGPKNSSGCKGFFSLPMPLKLHGDAGVSVSGRRKDYVAM